MVVRSRCSIRRLDYKKNKILHIFFFNLLVGIVTICFCMFCVDNADNENDYVDFSDNWYSNGEKVDLAELYKYKEVSKILPKMENDVEIYANVKSINVDIYINDKCIYQVDKFNTRLFGKTPGSYFVKLDINKEDSGKLITIKTDDPYGDKTGKITEIYIGDGTDIILNFISTYLPGLIISSIIMFVGAILVIVFIPLKINKKSGNKMLCLGLFALSTGLFMVTDCKALQILYGNEQFYHVISETSMLLIVVPLLLFIDRVYEKSSNKKIIILLCIISIINFVICYILNVLGVYDYHQTLKLTHATYILCIIYILYVSIRSYINRNKQEFHHITGLMFICVGCITDILILKFSSVVETSFFTRVGVLIFLCLEGLQMCIEYLQVYRQQERIKILSKLAYQDALTELLNRTSFMSDIEIIKNKTGLVAVFDVNDLKYVNDTYGHTEGDKLIITMADTLKDYFGKMGKCYRIGGDEFVFISIQEDIENKFPKTYTKLTKQLNKLNKTGNVKYKLSLAMGYSTFNKEISIKDAFDAADSKMYKNKNKIKKAK